MNLSDLPRPLALSIYEHTRREILQKHQRLPGVVAILEFGTIPHPGISDMDFFIVVEPDTTVILPHFSLYTEEQRFAMVHRHFVLSERLFQDINEFDPWFVSVQTLYDPAGKYAFQKEHFDPPTYEALSLNFLYQKLTYGCLPLLARILHTDVIPCRPFFETIKLFQYFLREFKKLSIPCGEEDPALPLYRTLADQWFTFTEREQRARMQEALERYRHSTRWTARTLWLKLRNIPEQRLPHPLPPRTFAQRELLEEFPHSFILDLGAHVFIYQKNRTCLRIEHGTFHCPLPLFPVLHRTTFLLPLSFACFSTTHLALAGCLSHYYQAHACTDLPTIPQWHHPRLRAFYQHANENIRDTRNVQNGKYYEITYGYRPPVTHLPHMATHWLRGMPSRALSSLHQRSYRRCFQEGQRRVLWESPLA